MTSEFNDYGQPVGYTVVDWQPARHPQAVILEGTNCIVRPLTADAIPVLFDEFQAGGDALWTYLPYGPFSSAETYGETIRRLADNTGAVFYMIVQQGRPCGLFALSAIVTERGSVELAHVLFSTRLQRSRAATEAVHLIIRYVFELGYRRCEWKCNALNAASRRAAQRFGFSWEGCFRQHMVVKGRNRDTSWFAMTADDWPAIAEAHRCWLADDNFDSGGEQRTSLSSLTAPLLHPLAPITGNQ